MSNAHVGPHNITLELVRIAHQQFPWQVLPNTRIASRYFRVFGDPEVNAICEDVTGLSVAKIYLIGMCFWGLFHKKPFSARTITSTIPNISNDDVKKFSMRYALDLDSLRALLKAEHSFDAAFAYRHSSLRAYPLIGLAGVGDVGLVCPLPTLLFRRFTSGLYYDLVNHANFGNAFGPAFQRYVGDVLTRASAGTGIRVIPEEKYGPKAHRKDTVDWIAAQGSDAAVFLECKTKRLSIGAKSSIAVQADLNADISTLADGVVQMYKTIRAYRDGHYRCLPFDQRRRVFPVVVTLENWFAFGPPIGSELERQVREKFASISLPATLLAEMPYTILGCDELEVAAQIWSRVGLTAFFEPKLTDARYRGWILDGYMRHQFGAELDAAHPLFEDAFDDMYRRIGIAV